MLTWLIKWPGSIQSKQTPVGDLLLFSTTFWIWQASMHLCSIKKQTGDKVSRRDFLFKFATELREDYIVEDQAETLLLLDLSDYRQLLKNTKAEKRKQRQIAANALKTKPASKCNKTVCGKCTATKLFECVIQCVRQRKYETFFNFMSTLCSFLQVKLFFMDRLIELCYLSICSTLKLHPHHAYTSKNAFSEKRSQ